ncbi:MAG TPA: hypothetical protein VFT91_09165 [Dehalococcoidia bacterium]|nr:hypothetical protein [Dehalococcoidia bacterium]
MVQPAGELEQQQPSPVDRVAASLKEGLPQSLLLARQRADAARPRPYVPPTTLRSEAREALHDRATQDIARARFAFPNAKYPHYKTYVNHPQRAMGVEMTDGSVAYPDIVVVLHPENYSKMLGEVETNETVNQDVAYYEWRPYAQLAPLYLYVPVGKGDEALSLCRRYNVSVVGIRTWRYVVGYEEIEINDHCTVPSGPEEILPKILRRG